MNPPAPAAPATATAWQTIGMSGGGGTYSAAISPHDPKLMLIYSDMSGGYRSTDGGRSWTIYHWRQLAGLPGAAPVFHPTDAEVIFAAHYYTARLKISRDRGRTWEPHGRGLPGGLQRLAISAARPDDMLAAAGEELFFSADGGRNWTPAAGAAGQALGLHFDAAGQAAFLATPAEVFRSDDGGRTWRADRGDLPRRPLRCFAAASNARDNACLLYAALAGKKDGQRLDEIYRSNDRGRSWTRLAAMPVHALLAADARPLTVYAVNTVTRAENTVARSDDGGATWRSVTFCDKTDQRFNMGYNYITAFFYPSTLLGGWDSGAAAINPANPEQLLFSNYSSVFITENGGRSWFPGEIRPHPANPNRPDAPISDFRWLNNGLVNTNAWNYYLNPNDRRRRYICYTDLGLARSEDSDATWIWMRDAGVNCYELAFDPDAPGRIWAAFAQVHDIPNNNIVLGQHGAIGGGCLGYSEDFGVTWRNPHSGAPVSDASWTMPPGLPNTSVISVILDPSSPVERRVLYASLWEDGVYRSADGGRTWEKRSAGLGAPGVNLRVCRLRRHADGTLFCLITSRMAEGQLIREGVGLFRSRDAGLSWEETTAGQDWRWLSDYEIDPEDSSTLYLGVCTAPRGLEQAGLYRTLDSGRSWERLARKGSSHFGACCHPRRRDWIYMTLTANDGVTPTLWLSRDRARTWQAFEKYPFGGAHRLTFDPQDEAIIYVTSYGGGVWRGPAEPG